jgi:hypothetical protein
MQTIMRAVTNRAIPPLGYPSSFAASEAIIAPNRIGVDTLISFIRADAPPSAKNAPCFHCEAASG